MWMSYICRPTSWLWTWNIGMQASDPVTMSQTMFQKAFFKALFDLKVEKLKKKIEEKWGSNLDRSLPRQLSKHLEKNGKHWDQTAQAKQELYSKLANILTQKKKQ